jgi:hypothetical protein
VVLGKVNRIAAQPHLTLSTEQLQHRRAFMRSQRQWALIPAASGS